MDLSSSHTTGICPPFPDLTWPPNRGGDDKTSGGAPLGWVLPLLLVPMSSPNMTTVVLWLLMKSIWTPLGDPKCGSEVLRPFKVF